MNDKPTRAHIVFPTIASALGGAVRVEYTASFAWIFLPSETEPVRMHRAHVPALPSNWTAFNLAELALAWKGAR